MFSIGQKNELQSLDPGQDNDESPRTMKMQTWLCLVMSLGLGNDVGQSEQLTSDSYPRTVSVTYKYIELCSSHTANHQLVSHLSS